MPEQPFPPAEPVREPVAPVTEPVAPVTELAGAPPVSPAPQPPVYTWQQPVEEAGPAPGVRFAGYGSRFVAYIIDGIVVGVATVVVSFVLLIFAGALASSGSDAAAGITALLWLLAILIISVAYFPYFWARGGQTPGMRMLRIRVVRDRDGGPVTGGQALLRFIGFIINSAVFYLGWIWVFIDGRRRGWHDLIAGTVVIEA